MISNKIVTALLFASLGMAQTYTIATAAGGASPGFLPGTGDGGLATNAGLGIPANDVALDTVGNLFVATGSLVRKVGRDGVISTFAGGGVALGEGVNAASAVIAPLALATDSAGALYIADAAFGVFRIRKVAPSGVISTVAGGGVCCSVADGPAVGSYLAIPYGIAVDRAGNVFVAQNSAGIGVVRKVTPAGQISLVAGGGACCASGDGGQAASAYLNRPTGIVFDSSGDLYIAESGANRVRAVAASSGIISTVAGSGAGADSGDGGPATNAGIAAPWHLSFDSAGNLIVTEQTASRVRSLRVGGAIATIAGTGTQGLSSDGGLAASAPLDRPAGLAAAANGSIYIAEASLTLARVRQLIPGPAATPPVIANGGVVSASAFGQFTSVAPGSWIEIYGSNLSSSTRSWSGSDFAGVNAPVTLDGTKVTISGQSAFIDFISPGQVNAQVPSGVPPGPAQLSVTSATGTSTPVTVTVNPTQAGLLAPPSFTIDGKQYVAALFPDGATFALPSGAIGGLSSRPAKAGDTLTFYGIGFGSVVPDIPAGRIVQQANALAATLQLQIGPSQATLTYQGLAPNAVGLYQLNAVVPSVAPGDAVPVSFTLGGIKSAQTLFIAIQ